MNWGNVAIEAMIGASTGILWLRPKGKTMTWIGGIVGAVIGGLIGYVQ
ncbi:hypothetical protein [Xylocopilactobacillus apis]|uniref:Uncharacterized protein n=1 Tax=Xylocopilactobacillus apis TaxID=2932183 RepID=A0AAU9DAK3_9LACO|nr:hypothetical protein [Xylocopilactobacillus apis]BDR56700.1 hypothetical protein KIMC2_12620 [Xylocopilactobacillus apis]